MEQRAINRKSATGAAYCRTHLGKREKRGADYQTTTIINTDDAIPGSAMFVRSSIESNKKLYPWSQFIIDSDGVTRKAWQLDEESSAVAVLDKDGRVQWAKDGALTKEEAQQVVALLRELLSK